MFFIFYIFDIFLSNQFFPQNTFHEFESHQETIGQLLHDSEFAISKRPPEHVTKLSEDLQNMKQKLEEVHAKLESKKVQLINHSGSNNLVDNDHHFSFIV